MLTRQKSKALAKSAGNPKAVSTPKTKISFKSFRLLKPHKSVSEPIVSAGPSSRGSASDSDSDDDSHIYDDR